MRKHTLLIILAIALVLRVVSLNQSLWLDEATSVNVVRSLSVNEILTNFSPNDFHPPLYYLLLKGWILVFGSSEIAARSLSIIFGMATVWIVYLIGKKLFSEKIAILSSLFVATSGLHVYYSQEARMYAMAAFLSALLVYLFIKAFEKQKVSFREWAGIVLVSILILYTNYFSVLILPTLGLYLLLFERGKFASNLKGIIVTRVIIIGAFVLWIPTLSSQIQGGLEARTAASEWFSALGRTSFRQLALVPIKFMIGRISVYDRVLYALALIPPTAFFVGAFFKSVISWQKAKLLWFWLLVPIIIAAIVGLLLSGFTYFRLLFVLPAFYLLAAYGALSLKDKNLKSVLAGGLILINVVSTSIYLFNPRFHREDWRSAVLWIEQDAKDKNAATLFVGNGQLSPYQYYAEEIPAFGPQGLEQGSFDKIYLVRYVQPILDPEDVLRGKVEEFGYQKVDERDFNGIVVWEYTKQ